MKAKKKTITYGELKKATNKTANYFKSLGIKKGDMVMLILKRRYEFWYSIIALHKLGAVVIPATHLLTSKDIIYRCNAAKIKLIVSVADEVVAKHIEDSVDKCETLENVCVVNGSYKNFLSFDEGINAASDVFERPVSAEEATTVEDNMLLYFTSGTTGNPKMVCHTFDYPLGHIPTAKYWHKVIDDGLHLTVADTGW